VLNFIQIALVATLPGTFAVTAVIPAAASVPLGAFLPATLVGLIARPHLASWTVLLLRKLASTSCGCCFGTAAKNILGALVDGSSAPLSASPSVDSINAVYTLAIGAAVAAAAAAYFFPSAISDDDTESDDE
jgi:hypothetical protein